MMNRQRMTIYTQTVQSDLSFARSILFNGCHLNHWRVAVRERGLCQDRSFASGSSLLVRSSSACGGESQSGTHSPPVMPYQLTDGSSRCHADCAVSSFLRTVNRIQRIPHEPLACSGTRMRTLSRPLLCLEFFATRASCSQ